MCCLHCFTFNRISFGRHCFFNSLENGIMNELQQRKLRGYGETWDKSPGKSEYRQAIYEAWLQEIATETSYLHLATPSSINVKTRSALKNGTLIYTLRWTLIFILYLHQPIDALNNSKSPTSHPNFNERWSN